MKCRFCQKQTIPITGTIDMGYKTHLNLSTFWECLLCPHSVRQSPDDQNWYSIMYYYNENWYEISQELSVDKPRFSIFHVNVTFGNSPDTYGLIDSKMILELNLDAGITPTNIESKFPTLMVFS